MPKKERGAHPEKLTPEDKLSVYWESINYIVGLNRSSEIKAGLIISFYGLLLGVVLQVVTSLETTFKLTSLLIVVLLIFAFFVCRSIYFSFRCFLPQIETKFNTNMFFFHDVITKYGDINSFSGKFIDLLDDEERLYTQLGEQIFVNSLIADKKFADVNNSVKNLVYSFIPMLIGVFIIIGTLFL